MTNATTGTGATSVTLTGSTSCGIIDLSGSAGGALTINTSASSGNFTLNGAGGADTITAGSGTNTINAGGGADSITLSTHTNVQTIAVNLTSSVATSSSSLSASVAPSDTLTFANGVDVVTGFVAGAAKDVIDNTDAVVTAIATGIGQSKSAGFATATTTYYLSGAYNATSKVFTIAADGAGADTLVVLGDAAHPSFASHANDIVLVGVNSANLVAGNFA